MFCFLSEQFTEFHFEHRICLYRQKDVGLLDTPKVFNHEWFYPRNADVSGIQTFSIEKKRFFPGRALI